MKIEERNIISLRKDFMFSIIFNNERNVSKLERFIAGYYGFSYEEVHGNLRLIPRELPKKENKEAKKQVDLILELEEFQLKINLEVESRFRQVKKDRNTIYLAKISSTNYLRGDRTLQNIWKSKQINFALSDGKQRDFIEEYYFRDKEAKEIYTRVMQIDRVNVQRIHELEYQKLSPKEQVTYDFCKMLESTTEKELKRSINTLMNEEEAQDLIKQVIELSGDESMITLDSEYTDEEIEYYTFMAEKKELEEERKSVREELENVKKARENLKKAHENVKKEHENAKKEHENAKKERENAKKEHENAKKENERLKPEKDHIEKEKDHIEKEKDHIKQEKDNFEKKKKNLMNKLTKMGMSQKEIARLLQINEVL